jgi:hypothetical protein
MKVPPDDVAGTIVDFSAKGRAFVAGVGIRS